MQCINVMKFIMWTCVRSFELSRSNKSLNSNNPLISYKKSTQKSKSIKDITNWLENGHIWLTLVLEPKSCRRWVEGLTSKGRSRAQVNGGYIDRLWIGVKMGWEALRGGCVGGVQFCKDVQSGEIWRKEGRKERGRRGCYLEEGRRRESWVTTFMKKTNLKK